MRKVLVTGGLGYIGSHTITSLVTAGYTPIIIDNLSNSTLTVLSKLEDLTGTSIPFMEVEMCNQKELISVFETHREIESVIHFGAVLQVHESVEKPNYYYRNNLLSTINLIDACNQYHIDKIVFSSSCTVYGQPKKIPVTESTPIQKAESPYGNTKIIGEQMLEDASKAYGLKVMSLRYFNPIGAHDSGLIGEVQQGTPHHLVPYITETASGKRKLLNVFGGDYNTSDGTCVRDYIHVMDIADAHVAAVDFLYDNEKVVFEVINLGSGTGQTVLEMLKAFEESTGIKVPFQIVDRRPGDVEKVYADITKAKKSLNWSPTRSLKDMMLSAWQWQQNTNT